MKISLAGNEFFMCSNEFHNYLFFYPFIKTCTLWLWQGLFKIFLFLKRIFLHHKYCLSKVLIFQALIREIYIAKQKKYVGLINFKVEYDLYIWNGQYCWLPPSDEFIMNFIMLSLCVRIIFCHSGAIRFIETVTLKIHLATKNEINLLIFA